MLEHERITSIIIGAAIQVQRQLGPGFLESVYEEALCLELTTREVQFLRQSEVVVYYNCSPVGMHRLDLIVEDTIVVDLKAITTFEQIHFAILRSQLMAAQLKHGLLINFGKVPLQVKRVLAR